MVCNQMKVGLKLFLLLVFKLPLVYAESEAEDVEGKKKIFWNREPMH